MTSIGNPSTESAIGPVRRRPPAPFARPLETCPGCGSWQLQPVVAADAARLHLLCGSCSRCWRVELGYVQRVHPDRCDGCPQPQQCSAAYAAEHPDQPEA